MAGEHIEWYGPERLKEISAKLEKNMHKSVLIVERDAKINAPVDTGRLRASITNEVEKTDNDIIGRVGTNVKYASFQEHGTSKMAAHPYLFPALEANRERIKELLKDD